MASTSKTTTVKSTALDFEWGNTKFLAFDGVDDKAEFTVNQSFITAVAGEGYFINTTSNLW